jgi:cytochrome c biogenesis protein CcmG, thiol:disulfide interchange protein DsbE
MTSKQRGKKRFPVLPAVAGLAAALALVAVLLTRGGPSVPEGVEQTRPVELSGAPLPMFDPDGEDPAEGNRAPELRGMDFQGDEVAVAHDGRAELLIFLAHWCPHCRREVPLLVEWLQENGEPENVGFYAVATSTSENRPNYPPSTWLEEEGFDVRVIADDEEGSAAQAFGLNAFPYVVLVDGEGTVLVRHAGEFTMAELEDMLAEVDESPPPAGLPAGPGIPSPAGD